MGCAGPLEEASSSAARIRHRHHSAKHDVWKQWKHFPSFMNVSAPSCTTDGSGHTGVRQNAQSPSGWFSSVNVSNAVSHSSASTGSPIHSSAASRRRPITVAWRVSSRPLASVRANEGAPVG